MRFTKKSQDLIQLINSNNKDIINISHQSTTDKSLIELYTNILESYNFVKNLNHNFYKITTKEIISSSEITKPNSFSSNSFPSKIMSHINETITSEITYQFSLYDRRTNYKI